jgi:AcrR family transcriptional regulator
MSNIEKDDSVREQILEASREVFLKWGIKKTTMEDIAHAAGKGKSTLYYYFKNKEEIFDAGGKREIDDMLSLAIAEMGKVESAVEKFEVYIRTGFQFMKKKIGFYSVVMNEISDDNKIIKGVLEYIAKNESRILHTILEYGAKRKEFIFSGEDEIRKTIHVLMLAIRGVELELVQAKHPNQFDSHMDILTKILLNGIRA